LTGFGLGAGQIGRQKIRVLVTATKNNPSNRGSRERRACSQMRGSMWKAAG